MAVDENGNEIIQTATEQEKNPTQERIIELSDKVKAASGERDTQIAAREVAERERDFYKSFSETVVATPQAKDHQEEIKERVLKGYSMQDATFAVLGAAGKLGSQTPAATPQVAGGSATTTVTQQAQKSPTEMTQAERRAQLEKDLRID